MMTRVARFDRPLLIAIALLTLLLFQNASPQARDIVASDERCAGKDRLGTCEPDRQQAEAFDYPALLMDSMIALESGFAVRP